MTTLHYLGPEGTFTHQAAIQAAQALNTLVDNVELQAEPDVSSILDAVQKNNDWGAIAWENNIEGYVVPNLDALIDAPNAAAFARVGIDVSFDAFVRPSVDVSSADANNADLNNADASSAESRVGNGNTRTTNPSTGQTGDNTATFAHVSDTVADSRDDGDRSSTDRLIAHCSTITAHPHGLAQCRRFAADHHLTPLPAVSNGAACRDLQPGQVALGPSICGDLYSLTRVATAVEDYPGAHTEFLILAPRDRTGDLLNQIRPTTVSNGDMEFESVIAFIPLSTGPGVLANLLDVLRDAGLNMTSFISRPIKGHDGTYSFIATIDAAPWQSHLRSVLIEAVEHGDWVKTLAVYPRRERPNPPVYAWSLPNGGVQHEVGHAPTNWADTGEACKELLW